MLEFLNNNSGAIQSIMVIVLASITAIYVWDTRRLANIAVRQLDLFTRPTAVVGESIGIIVQQDTTNPAAVAEITDFVRFIYSIRNIGNVPLAYLGHTTFNDFTSRTEREAILYPGQTLSHRTETYKVDSISPRKIKGIASIKIVYWSIEFPKQKKFFSRRFEMKENAEGYDILDDSAGDYLE